MSTPTRETLAARRKRQKMTEIVITNTREFGLRESADFLENHADECDPAYLAAVAESMRQAADALAAADGIERAFRQELWLGHGHESAGLYGDDCEMQCQRCRLWDYRRAPIDELVRQVRNVRLERLAAKLAEAPERPLGRGRTHEPTS